MGDLKQLDKGAILMSATNINIKCGELTAIDPIKNVGKNNTALCKAAMLVRWTISKQDGETYEKSQTFFITAWGKEAKKLSNFMPGDIVIMQGEDVKDQYEDASGQKRWKQEISVRSIELVKAYQSETAPTGPSEKNNNQTAIDIEPNKADDDLPF